MFSLWKNMWINKRQILAKKLEDDTINAKGGNGMQGMFDALELSNYICDFNAANGNAITNLQLQKILYYIQGYFLKKLDRPAFDAEVYHWTYGPVVPDVYYEYSSNIGNPITEVDTDAALEFDHNFRRERKAYKLFHVVLAKCLQYTARQLVSMTHKEAPWENTRQNECIEQGDIDAYFSLNDPLKLG